MKKLITKLVEVFEALGILAIFLLVLLAFIFLAKGCIDHGEEYREQTVSFLLKDPRALAEGREVWITVPYDRENARWHADAIIVDFDGKEYEIHDYIQITNTKNNHE